MLNLFEHKIIKEFVKFAIVGISNTLIHLLILYLLVEFFSVYYIFASLIAFIVAVTNSFVLNTLWTFKKNIKHKVTKKYSRFFIVSIIAAIFNLFFLYLFTEYFELWYMLSQLMSIIITLIINFVGNKFWTFYDEA